MTLFFVVSDFWPKIVLTSDYSLLKIVLITDFGPEILLITYFEGIPVRPSYNYVIYLGTDFRIVFSLYIFCINTPWEIFY